MHKEIDLNRKVVVTGMGMISPLGLNVETSWQRLIAGESGIVLINIPWIKEIKIAGIVQGFNPEVLLKDIVAKKDLRRISQTAQFSTAAVAEACRDAGLLGEGNKLNVDPTRVGIRVGTGIGGAFHIAEVSEIIKSGGETSPFDILRTLLDRTSSVPSMKIGTQGPLGTLSAACATGNMAITDGYKDIFMGEADRMIVGGADSTIEHVTLDMFDKPKALSRDPDPQNSRGPFDKKSTGFKMGEGAVVLILEREDYAKKRGAKIYAELVGYGNTSDAYHDTAPSGEGAERAIEEAIQTMGGLPKEGLIYFHAHGTGTGGDGVELNAIRKKMEKYGITNYVVSSTKEATGHMLGAAGAAGAVWVIKALNEGILPPTLHLEEPVDQAAGIDLVPNKARKAIPIVVFNSSFGFGGHNTVTAFRNQKSK